MGYPSDLAVKEAAWGLARYARVCQECGLVPIVEPEGLIDGTHKQEVTAKVQERFIYLNEINKIDRQGPWALTFSFSRAMQSSCIKIWGGKPENKEAAQAQLLARAQANSEASKVEYKAGSQPSIEESLYVKNYVY